MFVSTFTSPHTKRALVYSKHPSEHAVMLTAPNLSVYCCSWSSELIFKAGHTLPVWFSRSMSSNEKKNKPVCFSHSHGPFRFNAQGPGVYSHECLQKANVPQMNSSTCFAGVYFLWDRDSAGDSVPKLHL